MPDLADLTIPQINTVISYRAERAGILLFFPTVASLDRFEELCDRNLHAHHPRGTPPSLQELANLNIITVPRVIDDFLANDIHQETGTLPAARGLQVLGGQRAPCVDGDEHARQRVEAEDNEQVIGATSDSDGISVQSSDDERGRQLVDDEDEQASDDRSDSDQGDNSDDDSANSEVLNAMAEALADEYDQREWDILEYL